MATLRFFRILQGILPRLFQSLLLGIINELILHGIPSDSSRESFRDSFVYFFPDFFRDSFLPILYRFRSGDPSGILFLILLGSRHGFPGLLPRFLLDIFPKFFLTKRSWTNLNRSSAVLPWSY